MSGPNSVYGNYGLTRLIDSATRFLRPGGAGAIAFLRVKNFVDTTNFSVVEQMGFTFTPTSSGAQTGYTDYQIDPPPSIRLISLHNLGQAAMAGISLRAGARDILISNSFVLANMQMRGFADDRQVFEDPSTVGIVVLNEKIIVSCESIMPDYAYGMPSTWTLRGNALELK